MRDKKISLEARKTLICTTVADQVFVLPVTTYALVTTPILLAWSSALPFQSLTKKSERVCLV